MKLRLFVLFLFSLQACISNTGRAGSGSESTSETRIYVGDSCIVTGTKKEEAGLVSALLGILIQGIAENALSSLGAWIKKQGEAEKAQYSAAFELPLYVRDPNEERLLVNPNLECLVLVAGKFKDGTPDTFSGDVIISDDVDPKTAPESGEDGLTADKRLVRLKANGIQVESVDFLYEAHIEHSKDRTAFRLYSRFLELNALRSELKSAGLVVSLTIDGPSKDGNANTLTGALLNFGKMKPGTFLQSESYPVGAFMPAGKRAAHFKKGKGDKSRLLELPALSPAAAQTFKSQTTAREQRQTALNKTIDPAIKSLDALIENPGHLDENQKKKVAELSVKLAERKVAITKQLNGHLNVTEFMPIEVTGTVTETGDAKKALLFIAKVLEGKKKELATELTKSISPAAREAADVAEATSKATRQAALETAQIAYLKAKLEKENKPNAIGTELELLSTTLEAAEAACNRARAALNLPSGCAQ